MITTLLLAAALQTMPMQTTTDASATPSADVPRCSATVTDSCMEGGGMKKSMHHTMHKKMMHKKMMKKTTATAPTM